MSNQKQNWVDTNTAAINLGISPRQIRRLRSQGIFQPGKHYRLSNPKSRRPTYIWHRLRCANALENLEFEK